jgi:hypothetical protein
MTNVYEFTPKHNPHNPHYKSLEFLVEPEAGNAVVVSPYEDHHQGNQVTSFRFLAYNVRGYSRPPQTDETYADWEKNTKPQTNLTDNRKIRNYQPSIMTYPDVRIHPPLPEDKLAAAAGIVGTAYVRLRQDPTAPLDITQRLVEADVPFTEVTITATTTISQS